MIPEVYPDAHVAHIQLVWGQGFLSPGGSAAVATILEGMDIAGRKVLDVGCGLGGPTIELVKTFGAKQVLGIDINQSNLNRATLAVAAANLGSSISFKVVQPGVLPLDDGSFEFVFSKDALAEAEMKEAIYAEIFRVLQPGGWFVASDWLRADGPITETLQRWVEYSAASNFPHSLHFASLNDTAVLLEKLGFVNVEVRNRNAWYREEARRELERMTGELWPQLVVILGEEQARAEVQWHRMVIEALDSGDLCPSNIRAQKLASGQV